MSQQSKSFEEIKAEVIAAGYTIYPGSGSWWYKSDKKESLTGFLTEEETYIWLHSHLEQEPLFEFQEDPDETIQQRYDRFMSIVKDHYRNGHITTETFSLNRTYYKDIISIARYIIQLAIQVAEIAHK